MFGFGKKTYEGPSAAGRREDFIFDCAKAAANLYGVMALRDFADKVVAAWHPECREDAASPEMALKLEERARRENADFTIREGEIVHAAIRDDWARQSAVRKFHLGRTPWMPGKEGEFLEHGKSEELCVPAAKAFRGLCGKQDAQAGASMSQELIDLCRQGCGEDGDLDMAACLLPMTTGTDGEKIARALTDLRNKTRVWALFGHTAEELGLQREVHPKDNPLDGASQPEQPAAASALAKSDIDLSKIGRNDPCPCGSGKKYKKCCGR